MVGLNQLITCREKLKVFIDKRTLPPGLTSDDGIRYWQERLLLVFVFSGTFLGLFVYLPSVALSIKEDLWIVAVADTIIYGWVVILFFCRSIPFVVRAITFSLIGYILGMILLLTIGPFGGGPVWLFAFPVIVAILLGLRISLIALAVNAGTLIIIGALLQFGIIEWDYSTTNPVDKWVVISLNFMLLSSIVTISIALISEGIQNLLMRQKTMLASLKKSEEKFRVLFEFSPDAYYLSSLEGTFIDGNRTAEGLLGYDKEELIGKKLFGLNLLPSDQLPKVRKLLNKNLENKGTGPDEFILNRKNNETVLVEIRTLPIEIDGEKIVLGIVRDVSARRQLEAKLQQALKMESIGNLAGGIAHDFNNILSSVIGFTELSLDEVEKGTHIEDNLQEVYTAGKRAKDLVRQILAFARQSEEELKPIQVDTIAKEVLKFIRSSIPTTIEIKQNIESDSLIMGNATQVHQILMNLFTNAAHAMEDEGGILEFSLKDVVMDRGANREKLDLKPGNYIEIKVSDTGAGIAPEIIGSIFDPYFTTKGPGEGTGMGLAMVHGIVESYGGKISVDSKPGQGTLFTIYLPVTRKRQEHHPYQSETLPTGTERILFVDDEASIAKMGSQVLERLGIYSNNKNQQCGGLGAVPIKTE